MASQSAITLAQDNTAYAAKLQPAYHQFQLAHDKPIRKDYYVSRKRAAQECYRQRRNFMRFMLEHPSQRDTHFIDSNVLLRWLGLMA